MTVSLLPEFLAASHSETLAVQKAAVQAVGAHDTFEGAAAAVRPDIEIQGARRWLRRRIQRHILAVQLVATALGWPQHRVDLFELRITRPEILRHIPTPVGLAHRRTHYWGVTCAHQHPMGPDPPD